MTKTMTIPETKALTWKHKIGYGLGDAGGCMTFVIIGKFFSNFCTDVLGVNPGILSVLLFVWNVWDFINDPLMGALMDKSFAKNRSKAGKFRPWILKSAPLVCVSFIALWILPTLFDGIAMLIALFCLKVLYEASYTMFNIPMGSLLSAMSGNDQERASLSSARGIGSAVGSVVPIAVIPALVTAYGNNNYLGYFIGAAICAVLGLGMSIGHYFMTEERVTPTNGSNGDEIKVTDILHVFKVNRPFIALCIHGLSICLMQNTSETISSYFYSGVYGGMELMSISMAVTSPVMMVTFIFGPKIAKKIGLERFIRYGLVVGSGIYLALFACHMLFYINPYVHRIVSGLAMGLCSMSIYMQWGLVGEAIDYNEMITGKRTEGSIYGTFNLFRRLGQTIGMSLSVGLLDVFDYNKDVVLQSSKTVVGFKIIGMLLPGIFALGSWIAFKYVWNITDKTREKISYFKLTGKLPRKKKKKRKANR